jgi:hypothetical protein
MKSKNKQGQKTQERRTHLKKTTGVNSATPDTELTKDAIFLQPWFLPKDVYLEIRRLLPYIHLLKMRYYFEDYGCLKCGKKNALYQSNGLCETCGVTIRQRMKQSLIRRLKEVGVVTSSRELPFDFTDGMVNAQRILSRRTRPI